MLLCSVRSCRLPLLRLPTQARCERGHSFDIARSGYVNLLQPQDRRSRQPGDTANAVRGRQRLHESGVTAPLFDSLVSMLSLTPDDSVLDAGCGDGFYLGSLAKAIPLSGHGIDISTIAIEAAARQYPTCEWVVANADREIPYSDRSFSSIISITARRNPSEFSRILQPGGRLLLAVPAPDDLVEIRGPGARDRVPGVVEEFTPWFSLKAQRRTTTSSALDADAVRDVLHAIYRPRHLERVGAMSITFSLDFLLFQPLMQ